MIIGQTLLTHGMGLLYEPRVYPALAGLAALAASVAIPFTSWAQSHALKPIPLALIASMPLSFYFAKTLERIDIFKSEKKLWEDVITKEPQNITAWNVLALMAGNEKDYAKAEECYLKILALDPRNIDALNNLASLHSLEEYKGADPKKIEPYLKQAIEIAPYNAKTLENLARFNHSIGRLDAAIEYYQKLIALKPDDAEAAFSLGVAYGNKNEVPKAIESLKQALRLNPQHEEARRVLNLLEEHVRTQKRAKASRIQAKPPKK
jgi:tetratricopeptide (TPR) repeat protein